MNDACINKAVSLIKEKYGAEGLVVIGEFLSLLPTDATIVWHETEWTLTNILSKELLAEKT